MKKQHRNIFVLLFVLSTCHILAQSASDEGPFKFKPSFHQESGFSVFYNTYTVIPVGTYWGRLNLFEPNESLSISASCPFSIGGSIGSYGNFLALDIPVTLDINVGNRATSASNAPVGTFIGLGGGFNMLLGGGMLRSFGPLTQAGFRVTSPFTGKSVTLKVSCLFGLGGLDANNIDYNPNVYGIGVFYAM